MSTQVKTWETIQYGKHTAVVWHAQNPTLADLHLAAEAEFPKLKVYDLALFPLFHIDHMCVAMNEQELPFHIDTQSRETGKRVVTVISATSQKLTLRDIARIAEQKFPGAWYKNICLYVQKPGYDAFLELTLL